MAAAGLWTSSQDLARIGIEICKALINKSKVFGKKMIDKMLKEQIKKRDRTFGIGFFLDEKNDIFYHGGADEGFLSDFFFKKNGKGYVLLVNSLSQKNHNEIDFMNDIQKIIMEEYEWKVKSTKKPTKSSDFSKYLGDYLNSNNKSKCKLSAEKDKIMMKFNGYELPLYDWGTHFFQPHFKIVVEFEKNKMIMYQNGTKTIFDKI
jgi:hypothetical protein